MIFKNLCILVVWTKVALALEGLKHKVNVMSMFEHLYQCKESLHLLLSPTIYFFNTNNYFVFLKIKVL